MAKRILICDDHEFVRRGVRETLAGLDDVEVVGEATNGLEAIAEARVLAPDLLLLDAAMPYARGIEVFSEIKRWQPDLKVAVLTGFTSSRLLADWVEAGVEGLFLKSDTSDVLKDGVALILSGGRFISEAAADILAQAGPGEKLTARERQVLAAIAEGHANAAIAERLGISAKTVEKHRASLMSKLNVHSVSALITHALREGLLDEYRQL